MIIEIPHEEFKQRVMNAQATMQKQGIDLLLSYGNEAEPQFVRYFSNYWPSFETAGVLIPAEGDPMLLIGPESQTYAADRSAIAEIRLLKAFRESSEPEYPGKPLDTFSSVFNEVLNGKKPKRLGIAGLSLMTTGIVDMLRLSLAEFGTVKIEKADDIVSDLRMIKSENELNCMRAAADITRQTFHYVLNHIKPGMTEIQVVGLALGKMHELGAERESYPMWVLTGKGSNQAISRPRHKKIESGDMTFIQIGARVAGYASSIGRPVVFGKADAETRDLITAAYAGQNSVIRSLKAGVPADHVAKKHVETMTRLGYGDWLLYGPCHGNGLMEGEAPWIETSSDWVLQKDMTFCVDIFLGNNDKQIGLRMEDTVRITEEGVEELTHFPQELFEL